MNLEKVEKSFIKIAAIFLMATATIKLASAGQEVPFLTKTDPIFWFFTNRQVLFFAGLLELVVAAFLFFHTNTSLRIKTIAWLATIFLVYRIGVWLTGYRGPCNCLGGALDWLIKDRIVIENISKVLLGFFLCSYLLIFIRRKAGFRSGEVKHTSSFSSSFKSLIALILLMTPIYGHAQIFEVNGEIDFSAYNGDGSSYTNSHYNFSCSVNSNQWFLKTDWLDSYGAEYGSDGNSVFGVIYDNSLGTNVWRPALISKGTYPLVADPYCRVVWLAFASFSYLETLTNNLIPAPWADPINDPFAYIYTVQSERSKTTPHIPLHLKFVAESVRISAAASNPSLDSADKSQIEGLSHIPAGWCGGEYLTTATSNFNELEIPQKFEMRQYNLQGLSVAKWTGRVTKVSKGQRASFLPDINGIKVGVGDFRLREKKLGVKYINYSLTNGNWLTENDPLLREIFTSKVNYYQNNQRKSYTTRRPVLIVLILILFIPPFVLLLGKLRNKKTETK